VEPGLVDALGRRTGAASVGTGAGTGASSGSGAGTSAAASGSVAVASAVLPVARRSSRFGVVGIGFVLVAASVLAGAGVASTFVCLAAWAVAGLSAGLLRRVA